MVFARPLPSLAPAGPQFHPSGEAKSLPPPELDKIFHWDSMMVAIRLQYAWIPNEAVAGEQLLTGRRRRASRSGSSWPLLQLPCLHGAASGETDLENETHVVIRPSGYPRNDCAWS